jgi:hypothetical protein
LSSNTSKIKQLKFNAMLIKKNIILGLAIGIVAMANSCESFRCIDGNGSTANVTREVTNYDVVRSKGDFDVFISQDTTLATDSVEILISGDENLMGYIRTYVSGNTLHLETENNVCFRTDNAVSITLVTKELSAVYLEGSGSVRCTDSIYSESFFAELSGSGTVESNAVFASNMEMLLTGSGDFYIDNLLNNSNLSATIEGSGNINIAGEGIDGTYNIEGSGDINARNMRLNNGHVDINGSGDIYIWALNLISGRIDGSGDIFYVGYPVSGIDVNISGSGNIEPIN